MSSIAGKVYRKWRVNIIFQEGEICFITIAEEGLVEGMEEFTKQIGTFFYTCLYIICVIFSSPHCFSRSSKAKKWSFALLAAEGFCSNKLGIIMMTFIARAWKVFPVT